MNKKIERVALYVGSLEGRVCPIMAEWLTSMDIVDDALFSEGLDNLNDAVFKLERATRLRIPSGGIVHPASESRIGTDDDRD